MKARVALTGLVLLLTGGNALAQVTVKGSVYGGGNLADVKGNTEVNMSTGKVFCNVFGGGKGKADNFKCDKAMVGTEDDGENIANYAYGNTNVKITNGTVGTIEGENSTLVEGTGNVYGGGEVGRVEMNTVVTIGEAGNTTLKPIIYGSVFGAGAGKETHGYSALVRGNSTVTIQGKAVVKGNVHGGGEKASVGRYSVRLPGDTHHPEVRVGMPYALKKGGKCTVNIQDEAVIGTQGNDKTGHVYGAGQGITPVHSYSAADTYNARMNNSKRMVNYVAWNETTNSGYKDEDKEKTWDYYVDENGEEDHNFVWEYFTKNDDYLLYVETLARASETDVVIGGKRESTSITSSSKSPTVMGSVYGGSESGFVYYGTEVNIPKGTVKGDAFGGGKGLASFSEAGRVRRNTNLVVSGGSVEGNVYGGGSLGDVGHITKNFTNFNYTWTQTDGSTANVEHNNTLTETNNNTGVCKVTISGGTIGDGTVSADHGNVFGAGRGLDDTFWCEKAMVYSTDVTVSAGTVYGTVYGGGQIGRVEDDTKVTIGSSTGTEDLEITGDVFGAGAGVKTHGYSALVRGNTEVAVQGVAKVRGNVYGGGELASVGRYTLVNAENQSQYPGLEIGMPGSIANNGSGKCIVTIQGNAEIGPSTAMQMTKSGGPDDAGHVFGAGQGAVPTYTYTYSENSTYDQRKSNSKRMMKYVEWDETTKTGYKSTDEKKTWDYYVDDEGNQDTRYVWEYFDTEAKYITFIETMALTTQTDVIIGGKRVTTEETTSVTPSGNPLVMGSVYGGSENGFVQHNTNVTIAGGQIGAGDGMTVRYEDNKFVNPATTPVTTANALKACATWEYTDNGAPYDKFAGTLGYDSKGGAITAKDGHTFYGNVFGGGSGYYPYAAGKWHRKAGSVGGNTQVDITGGHILSNVYGGNEQTDVGTYTHGANDEPYIADGGKCTINMSGGTVGVPRDAEAIAALPTVGHIFGAGKGDKRILFNTWTNVGETEVNVSGGFVYGNVYGGGEDGHVMGNAVTTISETDATNKPTVIGSVGTSGFDGDVFGGGQGSVTALTAGVVGGNVDLTVLGGTMMGSAYGGGRLASVGTYFAMAKIKDPNDNTKEIDNPLYGIMQADVNESTHGHLAVNLIGGTIKQNVFGGCMGSKSNVLLGVSKTVKLNLNGIDFSEDTEKQALYTSWGLVKDDNLAGTPYVVADAKKGCIVKGSIFGCNNMESSPLEDVLVHIYATQRDGESRITNPAEGAQTAKVPGTQTNGEYNLASFDVKSVYGGGNLAAYKPQGPNAGLTNGVYSYDYEATQRYAEVIIDGCDRTSIGQVYGGGNAASTPATKVTVNGTYEIGELFGGGNGKDRITFDGGLNYDVNPGANVGFYDYHEVENEDWCDTKEERNPDDSQFDFRFEQYIYGTGKAEVNIFGGLVHQVFGGSNTKGNVRKTAITLLEEKEDNGVVCCEFRVDEAYGGGKSAPMDAEAKLLMACIPGLKAAYGGAQAADVQDNVTLTITNGTFDRVFGGNNISGTIRGSITVNIEETGCRPIIIGELYGGGNLAGYSVYGYKKVQKPVTENNVTTMVDFWEPLGKDPGDDLSGGRVFAEPQVNVKAFTSIGNVYGGGYGESAVMVADPTVNINVAKGERASVDAAVIGYDEGSDTWNDMAVKDGGVVAKGTADSYPIPYHKSGAIGAISNVFGGGNAAKVVGKTAVNVGTKIGDEEYMAVNVEVGKDLPTLPTGEKYYVRTGTAPNYTYTETDDTKAQADKTYCKKYTFEGVDIRGNVYGGGNQAEVTGDADVIIGKENQ